MSVAAGKDAGWVSSPGCRNDDLILEPVGCPHPGLRAVFIIQSANVYIFRGGNSKKMCLPTEKGNKYFPLEKNPGLACRKGKKEVTKLVCFVKKWRKIHEVHFPPQSIYAEWTLLPQLFGPVHFQLKGCLANLINSMVYKIPCI